VRPVPETPIMLEDYPKEVILKDGSGVTLRPLRKGDEDLLFRMFSRLSEDDKWFLDHNVTDFELIENWVKNMDPDRAHSIVCVLEGRIIAHANLLRKYYGAKSHIGNIRISVDPSFRGKHLATWMLLDLINRAMAMELEKLIMQLVEDRDAALIRSVKKLEFLETAVLKDYAKDREGNPHNLVIMVKRLHRLWDDVRVDNP
jgi:RimJ/RimL family protein N-acetyltransferase